MLTVGIAKIKNYASRYVITLFSVAVKISSQLVRNCLSSVSSIRNIFPFKCSTFSAYRSCQRGTNENTKGMIQQYFSNKTDFRKINGSALRKVVAKLNNRPRKRLGYRTHAQVLLGEYYGTLKTAGAALNDGIQALMQKSSSPKAAELYSQSSPGTLSPAPLPATVMKMYLK